MSSRSPKRRRGNDEDESVAAALVPRGHSNNSSSMRPLEAIYQKHALTELQDLKKALEHERSMRSLDQRRFQQNEQRLARQIQFVVEEAEAQKVLLEEVREESDEHISQLRQGKADTLLQLRECQEQLAQVEVENTVEGFDARLAQEKEAVFQEQLQSKTEEIEALRQQLVEVTQEQLSSLSAEKPSTKDGDDDGGGGVSLAPTEVLRVLNKVRIELAESERKYRQLRRKSDDWQQKALQYVQEREANRSATARVRQVEQELRELRKDHEALRATNLSWNEFAQNLGALVMDDPTAISRNGPPEIATVLRHLEMTKLRTLQLAEDKASLQKSLDTSNERIIALESLRADGDVIAAKLKEETNEVKSQLESANKQIQSLHVQEGIWRREADGLRSLLKTFDDLPGARAAPSSSDGGATARSLQVSLETAREEIRVLTDERDRLTKEMESLRDQQTEQKKEHDRVVEKFGRLREALTAEKQKVENAERRADEAEALAGKGAFNMEETRVLHLQRNPLTEAIQERHESEIRALERQLEEATGQKPARGAGASGSEVDPQKLHQRLKEQFQQQIALFREGVYLMTGWKVDMVPGPSGDTTRFRARSLFAEQEQDHLIVVCNKSGDEIVSLDLAETPFAKLLVTTDSYQYMTKFDSIPAFMASVQLSLFEKQTMIAS